MADHQPAGAPSQGTIDAFIKKTAYVLATLFSLFCLGTMLVFHLAPWIQLSFCLAATVILIGLTRPGPFGRTWTPLNIGVTLAVTTATIFSCIYYSLNFEDLIYRITFAPTSLDIFASCALILACLDICYRVTGLPLTVVAGVFLLYALFGQYIPGQFGHGGYSFYRITTYCFMDTGIFGNTLEAACSYVFLFIIFGGFLSGFGGGDVFIELANGLAGRYRGGPAKVAVLSSALLGTIVGNAIANVATTGSFTIPLMKKVGYRPAFAGAVEAAASTGGQIMPPVMGAVAFVMAEMVGLQYSRIALAAAIPAVLYFFSVLIMVDCEAARYGLNGEDPARLPNVRMLLRRKWAYLFPIVVIFVALLGFGVSTSRAALLGIATTLIIPFVARGTDISLKKCIDALAVSGRDILSIIAACAVAGIIIGVLGLTGLGSKIGMLMMAVAHGNLLIMLIASMIFSIILGMGMPTVAAYIVAASVVAPPLVQAGLPMLHAHLFICYFAIFSAVTPPVALTAYTAAGIAGANPNSTGIEAFKLCLAAFIVPFMFVYSPALLMEGSAPEISYAAFTAFIGVIFLGSSIQGWFFGLLRPAQQILLGIAALMTIHSGMLTDLIGLGLLLAVILISPAQRRHFFNFFKTFALKRK